MKTRVVLFRFPLLLLGLVALSSGGCLLVAAGAAGTGAYFYYKGNVSETYQGNFESTWQATHVALSELGLPAKSQSRDAFSGAIESVSGKGDRIKIVIEEERPKIPTDAPRTKVSVRVATFGDADVSRRILAQIPGPVSLSTGVTPASIPAP